MDSPRLGDGGPVATESDPPTRPIAGATLDQAPQGGRSGRWPRRLAVGGLAAVLIAAAAVAAVVTLGSGSPSHASADTGVPAGETTTTVSRRTLTDSATESGTLGYKGTYELYDRLAEAGTFTWLPSAGSVIGRGGTLFRVNNLPVVLMYGIVPAYRTLKKGVGNGPDVTELNRNLKALGFDPYDEISELNRFSSATAAAVKRWQKAEGLKQTGKVELGRVVFAPEAQRVTKVDVSLGQDPPGSGTTEPAAGTTTTPTSTTTTSTTTTTTTSTTTAATTTTPATTTPASKHEEEEAAATKQAEEEAAKKKAEEEAAAKKRREEEAAATKQAEEEAAKKGSKSPADDSDDASEPGSKSPSNKSPDSSGEPSGGAGMLVLSTTSAQQVVQLKVKADEQQLAHVGESAPVTLPSGRIVQGHITEVGSVASESSGGDEGKAGDESESATIPVTLELDHPVARLDEAPVSVELVKSVRSNVLAVPATALTATAGGGYAIEVLEEGRRVELSVTPGMFANGYVQVEGPGIREGLTVIESE